jgi:hypothetical protein
VVIELLRRDDFRFENFGLRSGGAGARGRKKTRGGRCEGDAGEAAAGKGSWVFHERIMAGEAVNRQSVIMGGAWAESGGAKIGPPRHDTPERG